MEYMKPSLEIEEFDVLDVITASGQNTYTQGSGGYEAEGGQNSFGGNSIGDFDFQGEFVF